MSFDNAYEVIINAICELFFVFSKDEDHQITGITELSAFVIIVILFLVIAALVSHFATVRSRHHQYEYTRSEFVNQKKFKNEIKHLQVISEHMMIVLHLCKQLEGELPFRGNERSETMLEQSGLGSSSNEVEQRLALELEKAWKSLGAAAIFINYNDGEGAGERFCGVEHKPSSHLPGTPKTPSLFDRANWFLTEAELSLRENKTNNAQVLTKLYDDFLDCATCRLAHLDVGKNDARKHRRKQRHRNWVISKKTVNRWLLDENTLECERCRIDDEDNQVLKKGA